VGNVHYVIPGSVAGGKILHDRSGKHE